jgi:integrase
VREHKLRSGFSSPADPVFGSLTGTPLHWRNVARRGLEKAIKTVELDGEGRPHLKMHDLRHTFVALLIAQGRRRRFRVQAGGAR